MLRSLKLILLCCTLVGGLVVTAVSLGAQRAPHHRRPVVTLAGTALYGQTLHARTSGWTGHPTQLRYRWQLCSPHGEGCLTRPRIRASWYHLGAASVGHRVRVTVRATFTDNRPVSRTALTGIVSAPARQPASIHHSPTNPAPGQTVTLVASPCDAAPCTDAWTVSLGGHAVPVAPGPRVTVTFSASGTAQVSLTITDALGRRATSQQAVTVASSSTAEPTATTAAPTPPSPGNVEHCYANLSACGYPGPSTVGAANCAGLATLNTASPPAGTTYNAAENTLEVESTGVTIANTNLDGVSLYVGASDFTLSNSCLDFNGGGSDQTTAIGGLASTTGLQILNSTIEGANSGDEAAGALVSAPPGSLLSGDVFENTSDAVGLADGSTLTNSYVLVNTITSGAHDEDVYFNDASVTISDSTLINTQYQTAVVFGNTTNAPGGACDNHLTMTDNLVAGGGFSLYPCGNATSVGTSTMNVSGNDFARCLGTSVYQPSAGGYTCGSTDYAGADANGIWPRGGYYGLTDDIYCPSGNSGQTWSDNVWDDSGSPVGCVNGPGSGAS